MENWPFGIVPPSRLMIVVQVFVVCLLITYGHGILPLLGGQGPYVDHEGVGVDSDIPPGCWVSKVVMLARHGARYPLSYQYKQFKSTLLRLKGAYKLWGPLDFITDYEMFMSADQAGSLTGEGQFNGRRTSAMLGRQIFRNYSHLIDFDDYGPVIYASDEPRVVETAHCFADGLWQASGQDGDYDFRIVKVPVFGEIGSNTLAPEASCPIGSDTAKAVAKVELWFEQEITSTVERLSQFVGGMKITRMDITSLYGMCAFELNARGESQFCQIFTVEELRILERRADLLSYYTFGPGRGRASLAAGSVYANSTLLALKYGPTGSAVPIHVSFAHDMTIQSVISVLGILNDNPPCNDPDIDTSWSIGQITPMLSRITFERIECDPDYDDQDNDDHSYIRILLNGSMIPIDQCSHGPGNSCPLSDFESYLDCRFVPYEEECYLVGTPHLDTAWERFGQLRPHMHKLRHPLQLTDRS